MVAMITQKCQPPDNFFRWHDSGDLQSVWHLDRIVQVCERTPQVKHWIPTREYGYVAGFLATGRSIPANLVVRLSAHMIDSEPVVPPDLAHLPTSTVTTFSMYRSGVRVVDGKGSIECRAVEQHDNQCLECRACWTPEVKNVSYPQHT